MYKIRIVLRKIIIRFWLKLDLFVYIKVLEVFYSDILIVVILIEINFKIY